MPASLRPRSALRPSPSLLRRPRAHALALAAAMLFTPLAIGTASAAACTWNPVSGNWGLATNWSCGVVPSGPASDSATIAAGRTVTINDQQGPGVLRSIFTLNNAGTVQIDAFGLSLQAGGSVNNAGGVINLASGTVLNQFGGTISGGTINTAGTGKLVVFSSGVNFLNAVTLNGAMDMATNANSRQRVTGGLTLGGTVDLNANGILSFEGTQALAGSGSIVFGSTGAGNRIDLDGTGTTTFAAGVTVRGHSGTIGNEINISGTQTLVNNGTISADVAGGTITIAQSAVTNNGTLSALNGGALVLASNVSGGAGGQIVVGAGSQVLQSGVTISGTVNTSGSGLFSATSSGTNFLSGVTLNGNLDMASLVNSRQRVSTGGLVLNGNIALNNNGILSFEGNGGLSGSGSIVFGSTGSGNRIDLDGTGTTTFAAGTTVRGHSGTIGLESNISGTQTLVNNGTISADVAGGTVTIGQSAVTNNGTLSALNGGTLVLGSNVTGGSGGQIVAGAGSQVRQNGVTISGTVNTSGSGLFSAISSGTNYLSGVTLNGNLDMATLANSRERVIGGLTLNGTIDLNANGILSFEGTQTVGGTGTVVFGNTGAGNRIDLDGTGTTTFASGLTVRGHSGTIGQEINIAGPQTLANNGSISADVAGGTITITSSAVTNNGTLSALNGGRLVLASDVNGTALGQIVAGAGSQVLQNGVTISGIVNTSGSGLFSAISSGSNRLAGVTLNGNLDMASLINSRERVTPGGLVLNGTVDLNQNGILSFEGDGSLAGSGAIVFGTTGSGNRIDLDGTGTTTFASGITVRGHSGTIGNELNIAGTQTLANNGTISADTAGGTITLTASAVTNSNVLEARNGGALVLGSNVTQVGSGVILADNGVVTQAGVRITGGTIASANGGALRVTSSGANFIDGVTITGVMDMATLANSRQRVNNGATINGTLELNANGILSTEGNTTLAGSGAIVFGNTGAGNRIDLDGTGTATIANGLTVRGHSGTIGNEINISGTQTLVNNGTINAELAGGTIAFASSALVNNGLARAQAGTMNIGVALSGTGTLQVDSTGVMNLAAGAKTQGTLAMGAAGAALNLSTGNLTLSSDYTNAGAGSGNSFNRRAGVTGAGQIVAGGNAAQAISGAAVTGGNTTNATLTIGNVRVGANDFSYTVGNSGTTGPTLRGTLQSNVNGANLTDGRLSGSGVTASNYNAGAPAGSGETRTVTFTAASAGTLAPLSGQVLNLRSNFENIADQKLNIVLGAGAAAYNAAVGSVVTPVQVANQRVGGSNSAVLSISNTAAPGLFSEDLNASVASFSGAATASGSITGRLAGTNNTGTGAITVAVNATTAGAQSGSVNLNYQTAGTVNGTSNGLGTAAANAQTVAVGGNVYQLAAGAIQTAALNFGTVQVGQNVQQALVIRNTASGAVGFVEDLNASFGATSGTGAGLISGAGGLSGILAGSNSTAGNGSMVVSVNTSAAGAVAGSILVNYSSAGAVGGTSNGLGLLAVGSEGYGVNGTIQATGNVINQASPLVGNPLINLGAVRVGAVAPTGTVSVTNVATVAPQAALNASIAPTGGPINASGSFNLLSPGATNSSSLGVSLNTAVAGNYTGANAGKATISFVSDASNVGNCAPNCQLSLASQTVDVAGKVYQQAIGSTPTAALNFGVVRVGDTVSAQNIVINNTAAVAGLNDTLRADVAGVSGPFAGGGSVSGVAAQGSGNIAVGLNTATAGVYNQTGTVAFTSQNADMADISAGANAGLQISATVNNLANGDFDFVSGNGVFTQTGTSYLLDLGDVTVGTAIASFLQFDNDVAGPADELSGAFNLGGADDFNLAAAWSSAISNLAAGGVVGGLGLNWLAGAVGLFTDTIVFSGVGTNASDPVGLAQTRQLVIRANVVGLAPSGVPEPGSFALVLAAAAAAFATSLHRRRTAATKAVH